MRQGGTRRRGVGSYGLGWDGVGGNVVGRYRDGVEFGWCGVELCGFSPFSPVVKDSWN